MLACGGPGRAALSHRTAAAVWDLLPSPAKFDVTTLHAAQVDFLWRDAMVIVEVDGQATQLTPQAFECDRRRDAVLSMMGFRTLRFTWRQAVYEPASVRRAVAAALRG